MQGTVRLVIGASEPSTIAKRKPTRRAGAHLEVGFSRLRQERNLGEPACILRPVKALRAVAALKYTHLIKLTVPRLLLESRGDGSEALQRVKDALHEVALRVQRAHDGQLAWTLRLRADDGAQFTFSHRCAEVVGVAYALHESRTFVIPDACAVCTGRRKQSGSGPSWWHRGRRAARARRCSQRVRRLRRRRGSGGQDSFPAAHASERAARLAPGPRVDGVRRSPRCYRSRSRAAGAASY